MKTLHWIILALVFILATWFIYRTRATEARTETPLDLNWKFVRADAKGAEAPGFDDSDWSYISLPHDWMIHGDVARENPSGTPGGFYPEGIGWYRKIIDLSDYEGSEQFYLVFDGIQMNADVWFNGQHLGKQSYGYAPFYHEISDLVRKDTLNVLAVRSDCSELPVDRWYTGGGIFRNVKLIATSALHIPVWGTAVTSTLDSLGRAELTVRIELHNRNQNSRRFEIRYDIVDPSGRVVADGETAEFIEAGGELITGRSFRIPDPMLWSPSRPNLYTVNCYLSDQRNRIDGTSTVHGIRSAQFDPDLGFVLNGEKLMMKGVCIHHDGGALGAAVPLESWERRFRILKELGVNSIRLAHNPHASAVLDLCDRMGFLVINEMYDKWEEKWPRATGAVDFSSTWHRDLGNFVRRDRNHPSVVLWSVGNEVMEQLNDPAGAVQWYSDLKERVLEIDSTRMVTAALHPGNPDQGHEIPSRMMQVSPVVSYNYRTDSFRVWHERFPDLVFLASETKPYGTRKKRDYQVIDFGDHSWGDMEEYVAGHFIWAGIDYLGESAGWPDRGFRNGLMKTNGFIKPHAWYIGSVYRDDPMVKLTVKDSLLADSLNRWSSWQVSWAGAPLVDHWNFYENRGPKEVVIFTNCPRVDLELNGELLHTLVKDRFPDGVIKATIPYEPGSLVARAHFPNEQGPAGMVTDTLMTASAAHALHMDPDRERVRSGAAGVVHITTSVVDSTGVVDPHSRHLVNYQLQGPGKIRAIDNGDLADHTPPDAPAREVRRGRQLLILQAGSEPGDLIISASSEGLRPSQVKIPSGSYQWPDSQSQPD